MAQQQKYNIIVGQYSKNGKINVDSMCNGFTAINIGATLVTVNGVPLNPGTPGTNNGESFSIGGNAGEIFYGDIELFFTGNTGSVLIIQKYYIP